MILNVNSVETMLCSLQFQNILKMNFEEADELLTQICTFNKIFFEEHLGIRWSPPDLNILRDSNLESLQMTSKARLSVSRDSEEKQLTRNVNERDNWKLIRSAFETIVESMDYMIDDLPRVFELCEMTPAEQMITQIANIFSVSCKGDVKGKSISEK